MGAYILERILMMGFLFIAFTCNVNNGKTNSQKVQMSDTLKIEGCQENIKMDIGSIVEIKLEAIPGTGSQWLLKDSLQLLQQLGADRIQFSKPETGQPPVGQKVYQILHFKAVNKGEEIIHLVYKRIWEKEIADSCAIKVEVN